jgi:hypothetical protein
MPRFPFVGDLVPIFSFRLGGQVCPIVLYDLPTPLNAIWVEINHLLYGLIVVDFRIDKAQVSRRLIAPPRKADGNFEGGVTKEHGVWFHRFGRSRIAAHLGINDHSAERIVTPQFAVVFIGLA